MPQPQQQYVYQEYPKWRYHPDKKACVVKDFDAEKALGADWYDTQALADAAKEKLRQIVMPKNDGK